MPKLEYSTHDSTDDYTDHRFVCPDCEGAVRPADVWIQTIERAGVVFKRRYRCPDCGRSNDKREWIFYRRWLPLPASSHRACRNRDTDRSGIALDSRSVDQTTTGPPPSTETP